MSLSSLFLQVRETGLTVSDKVLCFTGFLFVLVHAHSAQVAEFFGKLLNARHSFVVCEGFVHDGLDGFRLRRVYSSSEKCTSTRLYELKIFDLLTNPR